MTRTHARLTALGIHGLRLMLGETSCSVCALVMAEESGNVRDMPPYTPLVSVRKGVNTNNKVAGY